MNKAFIKERRIEFRFQISEFEVLYAMRITKQPSWWDQGWAEEEARQDTPLACSRWISKGAQVIDLREA